MKVRGIWRNQFFKGCKGKYSSEKNQTAPPIIIITSLSVFLSVITKQGAIRIEDTHTNLPARAPARWILWFDCKTSLKTGTNLAVHSARAEQKTSSPRPCSTHPGTNHVMQTLYYFVPDWVIPGWNPPCKRPLSLELWISPGSRTTTADNCGCRGKIAYPSK